MNGTFGGAQPFFNDAVAGAVVAVKSGMGLVYALKLLNKTAAVAYLQIFDLVAASVTLGTTVPKWTIPLAASESTTIPLPFPVELGRLNDGTAGISIAGTTTPTGSTGAAISVAAAYQ